ncbi:chemotaxis protein CheB [Pedobacter sp. MC2016-05]|uniref:chemotaxis protein CheB n=1 Tax=Pedobacter sp. MC2016-05 TaxID=2994474 RepID=UPI002247CD9E|nr:chemotaxis protein CheB [Pedobacter sp. MC2016-05]MCX2472984.1 chemotaxis protein CheB [Pedobacter sp. MC2016-05]
MAQTIAEEKCSALVIGGSAGSLDVLLEIFPDLKSNLSFPIILVTHRKSGNDSLLTDLLKSRTHLIVNEAEEKQPILRGNVYITPGDYHLLIEEDITISLDYSEKVNYSRPSIDVTFQSAAEVFKDELVCILLSGSNADGVEGLKIVEKWGGRVIIQNPDTAIMPYMPQQALNEIKTALVLNSFEMAAFINKLNN